MIEALQKVIEVMARPVIFLGVGVVLLIMAGVTFYQARKYRSGYLLPILLTIFGVGMSAAAFILKYGV